MKCRIEIEMDNAAFTDDPGELARVLRVLAAKVQDGTEPGDIYRAQDINGNQVARLEIEED